MVLEHGFMSTAEGVEHYRRNLMGIAQCVQETANHDVMAALFSSDNYDRQWERDHGILSDGIRRIVSEEVYQYAAIQKQPNGLDIAIEQAKQRMGRYGAKPDTLVIPPKISIYLSMVRPEKTQYYIAGPAGAKNLRQGPDAMASFRGLKVFETRGFDVYQGEVPIDIGLRRRQVGEFYVVTDNSTPNSVADKGWSSNSMSTIVYDESIDNWRKISFRDMLNSCGRYNDSDGSFAFDATPKKSTGAGNELKMLSFVGHAKNSGYRAVEKSAKQKFYFGTTVNLDGLTAGDRDFLTFAQSKFVPKQTVLDEANTYPPDIFFSNWDQRGDGAGLYCATTTIGGFSKMHVIADDWHNKFAAAVRKLYQSGFRWDTSEAVAAETKQTYTYKTTAAQLPGGQPALNAQQHDQHMLFSSYTAPQLGEALFHASNQSEDLTRLFNNATVGGAAETLEDALAVTSVNAEGYTGHPGLHMSYKGLLLIAACGNATHAALAKEMQNRIETIIQVADVGLSGFARVARSLLPANYLHSSDGTRPVPISDDHAVRSVVFQSILNAPYGHSLVPIARDGSISAAYGSVGGDTIVCPSFAVRHFQQARAGIVGGLALTNVGLKIVSGRNTALAAVCSKEWSACVNGGFDMHEYAKTHTVASNTDMASKFARGSQKRGGGFQGRTGKRSSMASTSAGYAPQASTNPLGDMYRNQGLIGGNEADKRDHQEAQNKYQKFAEQTAEAAAEGEFARGEGQSLDEMLRKVHGDGHRITRTMQANYDGVISSPHCTNTTMRIIALILLCTDVLHKEKLLRYVDLGMPPPFTFILARPFIEHQMQSLVCMKAGPETGNTYYGHNSVTVGDDAISKMHYVNLTFYSKAIVKESKNVLLLEDVYANGYVGGNDTKMFKTQEQVLGYDAAQPNAPSMFALMISGKEAPTLPNPLSITGEFGGILDKDGHNSRRFAQTGGNHYSTAAFYTAHFGLSHVAHADPARHTEMPRFTKDTRTMNTMCFQGTQFLYNSDTSKFDVHVGNTGHWGHTYPGVKAVREGQTKYMEGTGGPKFPIDMGTAIAPTYTN